MSSFSKVPKLSQECVTSVHPSPNLLWATLQDGAAFLLERRGDVHSALRIQIQGLDGANRRLVQAVRSGRLDLGAAAAALADQNGPGSGLHRLRLGGGAAALMRQRRSVAAPSCGKESAAALVAAMLDGNAALPAEVKAARDANSSAIAMCLRQVNECLMAGVPLARLIVACSNLLHFISDAGFPRTIWHQALCLP